MNYLPFLLAIIFLIVLLNIIANKLKIAYPILLVLVGLAISFIPNLPVVKVDPDWIFFIFLPPLLFEASWNASLKEMKKWWRMIGSFAFLVVLFSAFLVAIASNYIIPGFTIALGFVLGGIVSPPDAVSTAAITKFVKIPKSTSAILEGESLLNDASSLIILRFALVAVGTGQFIISHAISEFLWMIIGGVTVGLIIAFLFIQFHKRFSTDTSSSIILTVIEPYIMYFIAEKMECSGVLAVVAGGLYMSQMKMTFMNSTTRLKSISFWEAFSFLLNGIVFFIIGLELPEIVTGIHSKGISITTAIWYGVIVTVILIISRIISSFAGMLATIIFRPNIASKMNLTIRNFRGPLVLGWTGMRGVVSLAAALSIPLYLENGKIFPQRDLILFITFVVILLTLVIQGLTLPFIIRKMKPFRNLDENTEISRTKIKLGLKTHIYEQLKIKYENCDLKENLAMQRIFKYWEDQSKAQETKWIDEDIKDVLIEIFELQRIYLSELNKDPEIDEDLIRQQIHQIDLEEERIKYIK